MKQDENGRKIIYISLIFIVLAAIYFVPAAALGEMLPERMVSFRIAFPVAALSVFGAWLGIEWKFVLAFLFSCTGDAMGAFGSFAGQTGYFAAAHVMLIWAFAGMLRERRRRRGLLEGKTGGAEDFLDSKLWKTLAGLAVAAALAFAFALVIPEVPEGALRIGYGIYAVLIAAMFGLSLMQRPPFFAAGAALFLISDMILSWNRFVGPVPASAWLIMIPYYLGQLLLWLGAAYRSRTLKML